jgi:hypothetical protein
MRSSALALVLVIAACGGGTGSPGDDTPGDDTPGDDEPSADADPSAPDAPGSTTPDGSPSTTPDAAWAGECADGVSPTQTTTITSVSNLNFVKILSAGGEVYATAPFGVPASQWLRWTGSGWSQEAIPWPANIPATSGILSYAAQPTGNVILRSGTGEWLTVFDGTTMTTGVAVPASAGTLWAYAQGGDGMLHLFGTVGTSTGNVHVEVVENPAGGWFPAAPIPIPGSVNDKVAAVTAGGRVVVAYTDIWFDDDDPVHVHVTSRGPATLWTAAADITPTWAVRAYSLHAMAPPGGGLLLGASGAGSVIWRSPDGVAFGEYEQASAYGWLSDIHAQCLESPVVVAGYQTAYRLEGRVGGAWTTLSQRELHYIDNAGAVILPNGKTYFALGESNRHEYVATP